MDTNLPDLIPGRALNQVCYCPRLYYLEYVESVMPVNEYVFCKELPQLTVGVCGVLTNSTEAADR